jgi:hypothetical protein
MDAIRIRTQLASSSEGYVYQARIEYGRGEVLVYGPIVMTEE